MRIGVDIMGGDFFPQAPIEGAILAQKKIGDEVEIVLIGDEQVIHAELSSQGSSPDAFTVVHTDQHIEMGESPTKAIAAKPRSTINLGIGMMKQKQLDGFVSAGSTGAMLVSSIMGLGRIGGVSRPTIGVLLPNSENRLTLLCDVGANLDCKPEHLYHFGILGSIFMESVQRIPDPRIALLNVGEEASKGPVDIQAAHEIMGKSQLINFSGNREGRDIYSGDSDVYVCDGYTGNILLKFGESLYNVLQPRYPEDQFIETFNFENYGGVPILGIKGISIIGHGISTGKAIASMIYSAVSAAESQLVEKIEAAFASFEAKHT